MRPPEFTGGNDGRAATDSRLARRASMRPPEFTGGNFEEQNNNRGNFIASMRPPEFTGGNARPQASQLAMYCRFNEAAGIHRRKRREGVKRSTGAGAKLQ